MNEQRHSPYRPAPQWKPRPLWTREPPKPLRRIGANRFALTRRQVECLDFIVTYEQGYGTTPTVHDVAVALDIPGCHALRLVRGIFERGHIDFNPQRPRPIALIGTDCETAAACSSRAANGSDRAAHLTSATGE